jgi:hypothetical protein
VFSVIYTLGDEETFHNLGSVCFFEVPVEAEEKVEHGKHKYTRTQLYGSSPIDEIKALCSVKKKKRPLKEAVSYRLNIMAAPHLTDRQLVQL